MNHTFTSKIKGLNWVHTLREIEEKVFNRYPIDEISTADKSAANIERATWGFFKYYELSSNSGFDGLCSELESIVRQYSKHNKLSWSAICFAASLGLPTVVAAAAKLPNEDVNETFKGGATALLVACEVGDLETVEVLKKLGANFQVLTQDERSALIIACQNGHSAVVEYIVKNELVDIDASNSSEWTALMAASQFNHGDILSYLISKGANPACKTIHGWTALTLAVVFENLRCAQIICDEDITLLFEPDFCGKTPLMFASELKDSHILEALNKRTKTQQEQTPIHTITSKPIMTHNDIFKPIIDGVWKYYSFDEIADFMKFLSKSSVRHIVELGNFCGVRKRNTSFYSDVSLYEIAIFNEVGFGPNLPNGVLLLLLEKDGDFFIYNGTLEQVRILNGICGLKIDENTAIDYFNFAAYPAQDISGRCSFIKSREDLELLPAEEANARGKGIVYRAPEVVARDEVGIVIEGDILIDSHVHPSLIRVSYDGEIEFAVQRPKSSKLPIAHEVFNQGFRFFMN